MAEEPQSKFAKVVVLGDIGRSPRMQYHALSLANNGLKVNIIAYVESAPLPEILENPNITISKLNPLFNFNRGPQLIRYVVKAIWQTMSLLVTLFSTEKCDYLLCQNPPAIPTLSVCSFYCGLTKAKFIIDWHNYAYSILALALPKDHFLVRFSKMFERWFGKKSDHNFCVSNAMKEDLFRNWNIIATVLYDRPPKIFHPISLQEKHDWFLKISQQHPEFGCQDQEALGECTAFTQVVNGVVKSRDDRPGLLFSSTSWTCDEDFNILTDALQVYETTCELTNKLPKLICTITGKGPMKDYHTAFIRSRKWVHVTVITPWLEAADYPTMVASADLGVCLHTSTSGLDLPMKVVDMFGAGLPVCAVNYPCLNELVKNGKNGFTFKNSAEFAKMLIVWFEDFPNNDLQNRKAKKLRGELTAFQKARWEDNWNLRVRKYFKM